MLDTEIIAHLTQFGTAGLIGWMWLTERRAAGLREQQLTASHDRLMHQDKHLDVLLKALDDNTRALKTLEAGQQRLTDLLERLESAPLPSKVSPHDTNGHARKAKEQAHARRAA